MRKIAFLLMAALLAAGCGGGSGGGTNEAASSTLSFHVWHFVEEENYTILADKVAEGDHCYVYLEQGMDARAADSEIDDLVDQFDNAIYHRVRDAFGSEPNPGADGDPKVYILLMDIKDGNSGGSYIAGYFDPYNEYPTAPESNGKEIIHLDVNPGNVSGVNFRRVLAHEFQHMIHWEQKTKRLGIQDNTWLDEAMSEIAPYYAGYGPNYSRVLTFQSGDNRSDSLTDWPYAADLKNYAVVYMWAQYIADRFPADAFRNILASNLRGVASVEEYLKSQDPTLSFSNVFRDWSIAVFSGSNDSLTGNAAWKYRTIDTWAGDHYDIYGVRYNLPGMFTSDNLNRSSLPALSAYSIDMYWYNDTGSSFTWTAASSPSPSASAYDWKAGGLLTFDFPSGSPYLYDNAAILILQNAGGSSTSTSDTSVAPAVEATAAAKLRAAAETDVVKTLVDATGEPVPVCVNDILSRRYGEKIERTRREGVNAR